MLIYPSIDIFSGNAVGLYRGNFDDLKVYTNNPMEVVEDFVNQGATHLHLTDLDNARTGRSDLVFVKKIKEETSLKVQVGGGIRNMASIDKYMNVGVDGVVINISPNIKEDFVKEAIDKYGDKIIVSIDIKDGVVAPMGRIDRNAPKAIDYALKMESYGVKTLICADVTKVGNLHGIDAQLFETLIDKLSINIIASGGVSSLEDILDLNSMNMYGAIVGRAYYDGAIYVKEAIRLSR